MNYIKITPIDIANGTGCRVVLWTAGCSHHCKECHNPETWNENAGQPFDDNAMKELMSALDKKYIQGITFSGGDPLYKNNIQTVTEIAKEIKKRFPQKDIWLYTGYLYEDIKDYDIMKYLDILVDGEFEIDKKDITLLFRGSSNQRLIDVQKTRKTGEIILYRS